MRTDYRAPFTKRTNDNAILLAVQNIFENAPRRKNKRSYGQIPDSERSVRTLIDKTDEWKAYTV